IFEVLNCGVVLRGFVCLNALVQLVTRLELAASCREKQEQHSRCDHRISYASVHDLLAGLEKFGKSREPMYIFANLSCKFAVRYKRSARLRQLQNPPPSAKARTRGQILWWGSSPHPSTDLLTGLNLGGD